MARPTIAAEVRRLIAVATELLVTALDVIDGEPDREDDGTAENADPPEIDDEPEDDGTAEPEDGV